MSRLRITMVKSSIQFTQGTDEQTDPDVKLTNGMAIFRFDKPSVFDSSGEVGEITGFYMKGLFNQLMLMPDLLMESPQGSKPSISCKLHEIGIGS